MHDERDRRVVRARGDEAVQRLTGNPAGIAAVAHDERVRALFRFESKGEAGAGGIMTPKRPEPSGVPLAPGHVSGDIETTPNFSMTRSSGRNPSADSAGVIPDAGVAMFDDVVMMLVVHNAERHQQRRINSRPPPR